MGLNHPLATSIQYHPVHAAGDALHRLSDHRMRVHKESIAQALRPPQTRSACAGIRFGPLTRPCERRP